MEPTEIKLIIPPLTESEVLPPRVKLQAIIGVERAIFPFLVIGFTLAFVCGVFLGNDKKGLLGINLKIDLIICIMIGVGIILIAVFLWFAFDNYYILDRQSRRIFHHKGFRFIGTEPPFLEAGQVIAIGLDCAERRNRGGQYGWIFTPVLLMQGNKEIRLASLKAGLRCNELAEYNKRIRLWAAALQCYYLACLPGKGLARDTLNFYMESSNKAG